MMDAWMREPNQETRKRMLLMVFQTESLFCPDFLRENMNTAVTSVHTATEHQTLVDRPGPQPAEDGEDTEADSDHQDP